MNHPIHSLRRIAALIATLAWATSTLPAEDAATTTTATASPGAGEDVVELADLEVTGDSVAIGKPVITSTKMPLTIRQTPQAISTVERLKIDAESIFSVDELMRGVTGVYVSFYDTQRPLYFARGFQVTDFQVDGIPTYSGSTNQEYDMALYERVDIVRGATGLLSGAGLPSATVNMQRKRGARQLSGTFEATYGNWNYLRGVADVSVPFTADGRVRSRFVVTGQDRDSFRDRYSEKKFAWLASVDADLTSTTTLGVGYQFQDNDPTSPMWGVIPRFAADGSLAKLPRSTNFSTNWTEWQRDSATAFVTLDQRLGDAWQLRAAYNLTEGSTYNLRVYATGFPDLDTGANMYLRAGIGETDDVRDNIDIYLSGRFALLGREHDLVLGWNGNFLDSDSPTFASITSGQYFYRYDIPDYRTWDGEAPMPTLIKTGASRVSITDQSGYYGTLRLRPTDTLSLIAGARLSDWETGTKNYSTTGEYTGITGAYDVSDEITPYLGAVYDITKVWSAYASYTDIFRPQNYKDKNDERLAPVLGTNLEAGLKAEFFARRFQVSFGVFQTEQDNYAVRDTSVPDNSLPDGSSAYIGVDGTKSEGFEIEFVGFIQRGWTANLGYSHVNTVRHPSDLTYANVPEDMLRFSTHFTLPGAWDRLSVGTGVNWQCAVEGYGITSPSGPVTVEQGSFALVNLFANYRYNDHVTFALSVRNAFDKTYWATLDYPNYGEPRTIQGTVRVRF